jgi:hypothetical protein
MSVGLVYGKITGLLRRIVIPDNDSQLAGHVGQGEAMVIASTAQYSTFSGPNDIQTYLNTITGIAPSGYRAAMIDQAGNVNSLHHADPGCDSPFPGQILVWNDAAQPGWLFVNNNFVPLPGVRRRTLRSPRLLRQ